jgi:hypothetical protein
METYQAAKALANFQPLVPDQTPHCRSVRPSTPRNYWPPRVRQPLWWARGRDYIFQFRMQGKNAANPDICIVSVYR